MNTRFNINLNVDGVDVLEAINARFHHRVWAACFIVITLICMAGVMFTV